MEKTHKDGWSGFLKLCLNAEDAKTLSAIFDLLFTAEEKQDFSLRYLIIKELLSQEKTQRDIAKQLKVSIAKITRGSNEIKRTQNSLIQYLKDTLR